nr:hypothetical protein [uncultured Duganella sp.]
MAAPPDIKRANAAAVEKVVNFMSNYPKKINDYGVDCAPETIGWVSLSKGRAML